MMKNVYSFFDSVNCIIILNNDENLDLYASCELLKNSIAREMNCSVGIGLGNLKTEPQEICNSYREALDALDLRIVFGSNSVIFYNNMNFTLQKNDIDLKELFNKFNHFKQEVPYL